VKPPRAALVTVVTVSPLRPQPISGGGTGTRMVTDEFERLTGVVVVE
jgi:hypothetical protein